MKYLFIGLGSIGQRHLKNLRQITKEPIIAFRSTDKKIENIDAYHIEELRDFDRALDQVDAVFITNPTNLHLEYAIKAAKKGKHLFIEKPISHNLKGVGGLLSIAKQKNLVCFVAFQLRFHPNLVKIRELLAENRIGKVLFARIQVGQYLPDWHPGEDYTKGYSARKDLGGGVVLTLCHELDYARWLFGEIESVQAHLAHLSSMKMDVEDSASIIAKTKNNAVLEIHLDYIQKPAARNCEIIGENGKIEWNYFDNEVKLYKDGKEEVFKIRNFEKNQMYISELKSFLKCIENKECPIVTPNEILDTMKFIEAIKISSRFAREVKLDKLK